VKAPTNAKAQASYSLGVSMGDQLHHLGLTADSIATERLTQGLRDALAGKVAMTPNDRKISPTSSRARATAWPIRTGRGEAFLSENGKKKDVVTTASGLEYHVISPVTARRPNRRTKSRSTTVARCSMARSSTARNKRGQPASFPVNGVIPGWQEALVLMKPGAKWKLFIPRTSPTTSTHPPPFRRAPCSSSKWS